jgi:hypothetical protein
VRVADEHPAVRDNRRIHALRLRVYRRIQDVERGLLPAPTLGLVFLFQGDSITDDNRGRSADPNHVLIFYNRGNSGHEVSDLLARWPTDALALRPDVLSILVDINDINDVVNQPD